MFIAVLAASSLIQASHAVLYGFATLLWTTRGVDGLEVGALWSIGVVAEVVLFAFAGRIVPAIGAPGLVVLGGLGGLLRWGAMAFDPPIVTLPVLQCLHALSFGATHLGTMTFLADIAGHGRHATAQGDYVAVQGIVFSAAMAVSGALVGSFGEEAYAGMALSAAAGSGVVIVARRVWGR
jgi:PPP family 3-phenylpropionic acid transporter